MSFKPEQRERIWLRYCGRQIQAIDAFGRIMYKNSFEADHIWAESRGGRSVVENGIPLSPLSNQEKSDNINGYVNNRKFNVYHSGTDGVGELHINGIKKSL